MQQPVITISRQRGSGADEIALLVAQRLGIPLYDQQVLAQAAAAAGVSEETIATAAHQQGFLRRMLEALGRSGLATTDGVAAGSFEPGPTLATSADYRAVIEQVLRRIADSGPGVIVGHGGGQVALRGRADVLHVFLHAPFEQRVLRMISYANLSREAAAADVKRTDRERSAFFKQHYEVNWYDLRLYDLVLNTAGAPYAETAAQICAMAERVADRVLLDTPDRRPAPA